MEKKTKIDWKRKNEKKRLKVEKVASFLIHL
jgi:hypothetical protein